MIIRAIIDLGFLLFAAQGATGSTYGLRTEQWSGHLGANAPESFKQRSQAHDG